MIQNAKNKMERREVTDYYFDVSSGKKEYSLELTADKRGRAVIRNIEFQIFDPFFIGTTGFFFRPFYKTEILVLPKLQPVDGIETLVTNEVGNKPTMYSYFQDPTLIAGVRDYIPADSFKQIHWKATARMGSLQTRLLEKTTHQKWTFLLNVMEEDHRGTTLSFAHDLENKISHLAYLLQKAEMQGATYDIYVNIQARNTLRLMHVEEGAGKEHLIKGLELLARIDLMSAPVKVPSFIQRVEPSISHSSCIVLCGIKKEEVLKSVTNMYLHTLPYYELHSSGSGGGGLRRC